MPSSAAATAQAHEPCRGGPGVRPIEPQLSPERLDCYRVALEFNVLASRLIPRGHRDMRDHIVRAALSISANLAEGCGRRGRAEKAHFYSIARGSAMECAAIVDIVRSLGVAPIASCNAARWLLVRIVQMLTRLEAAAVGR